MTIGWEKVQGDSRKSVQQAGNCQTGFEPFVSANLLVVCDQQELMIRVIESRHTASGSRFAAGSSGVAEGSACWFPVPSLHAVLVVLELFWSHA